MISGGENDTNACPLAGFSEDVAFVCHFTAIRLPLTLPPCRNATELSKMKGNSASYLPNSW